LLFAFAVFGFAGQNLAQKRTARPYALLNGHASRNGDGATGAFKLARVALEATVGVEGHGFAVLDFVDSLGADAYAGAASNAFVNIHDYVCRVFCL
jgi:hypothetical protein